MREIVLNGRWPMVLPEHRAAQWAKGWERKRLDSIHDHLGPGHVIYDIGAEEGDMSALYSSWGAEVVLFEPNPRVWPNIRAIFEANDLRVPLGCFVGFAGDEPRDGSLTGTGRSHHEWPGVAYGDVIGDHGFCVIPQRPDIPTWRIDDVADGHVPEPDVITIDVEGAELRVLEGARHVLDVVSPVVYVSVHEAFMRDEFGDDPADIYRLMADLGYMGFHLATDHERHECWWPHGRDVPDDLLRYELFTS